VKNVVVVPDTAVQRGPNGLFAYVVASDGKAELRDLKVGRIGDGQVLVEQGLTPGERIITSGHYRVQPGERVEVIASPDRPAAAANRPAPPPVRRP
jgi:multidrug efflux system membrane fusion protein